MLFRSNLTQHFQQNRYAGKQLVHALNGVSLDIHQGETIGIVGETGCGKSTLCKTLMRLYKPTDGRIHFDGIDITHKSEQHLKDIRKKMQMVFQDPADSMNPRLNVGAIIEEPLVIQTKLKPAQRKERVMALLRDVGLSDDAYTRYPHEFSGGQRQRIAIARALVLEPQVLVCDEPVSALDVSVQSQVLNLLLELQKEHRLTMVFVSHALNVVRHMSDRVVFMYLGNIMEYAASGIIYNEPLHPYTQALIAAIPEPDPSKRSLKIPFTGEIPSPINLPTGCPFHMNCTKKIDICDKEKPLYKEARPGHWCACHLVT